MVHQVSWKLLPTSAIEQVFRVLAGQLYDLFTVQLETPALSKEERYPSFCAWVS